ncbi:hypothetical protein AAF712_014259 [Marasmius tenuissimus]|uniref:Uncharacterized protein n=1 Tax=Marasmius tenuissimus TaxID=585030 RepID=A0ABR2ZBR2_9AGAR
MAITTTHTSHPSQARTSSSLSSKTKRPSTIPMHASNTSTSSGSGRARNVNESSSNIMNNAMNIQDTPEVGANVRPASEPNNQEMPSSHGDEFSTPSLNNDNASRRDSRVFSAADILSKTDRAAICRGKKPMPKLRIGSVEPPSKTDKSNDEADKTTGEEDKMNEETDNDNMNDEIRPEDSVSQRPPTPSERDTQWSYRIDGWSESQCNTRRPLPLVALRASQQIQSRVHEYQRELRCRYVLQVLRNYDLEEYSFTLIVLQEIVIDHEASVVYNVARPELTQRLYTISEAEVDKLRITYPKPFSNSDPSPYRRPEDAKPPNKNNGGNSGGNPGGNPPEDDGPDDHNDGGGNRSDKGDYNERRGHQPNRSGGPGGPPGDNPPSDPGDFEPEPMGSDAESERGDTGDQRKGVCYTSVDPESMSRNKWDYNPTPLSQDEMLRAAFSVFEKLIVKQLYCEPAISNSSVQKTLLQSLPKPGEYRGEDDLTIFDAWIRDLI